MFDKLITDNNIHFVYKQEDGKLYMESTAKGEAASEIEEDKTRIAYNMCSTMNDILDGYVNDLEHTFSEITRLGKVHADYMNKLEKLDEDDFIEQSDFYFAKAKLINKMEKARLEIAGYLHKGHLMDGEVAKIVEWEIQRLSKLIPYIKAVGFVKYKSIE